MKPENNFSYLDFEVPIQKLYLQIEQLHDMEKKSGVVMSDKILALENKIIEEKQNIQSKLTTWQKVQLSRHPNRPYTLYYIEKMCEMFTELHGDRNVRDDKAIVGGLGKIDGQSVMIIGSITISSMIPNSKLSFAVSLSASAAFSLCSQLLHKIELQDSGDITENHVFSNMNNLSPMPMPKAPPEAPSPIT